MDMYSAQDQVPCKTTDPLSTYPAFAPNRNIGFALTARHFCQTATKVPKRALPQRTALASVPLRGHAVTGHPWPGTALPASMPVNPLRRTSIRPPEGAGRSKTDQKQIKNRSKTDQKQIKRWIINRHLFCAGLRIEPECSTLLIEAMALGS